MMFATAISKMPLKHHSPCCERHCGLDAIAIDWNVCGWFVLVVREIDESSLGLVNWC